VRELLGTGRGVCLEIGWGTGAAARIDHVGSTSVPGLAAKAVIDIQVSSLASADSASRGSMLSSASHWGRRLPGGAGEPGAGDDGRETDGYRRYPQGDRCAGPAGQYACHGRSGRVTGGLAGG